MVNVLSKSLKLSNLMIGKNNSTMKAYFLGHYPSVNASYYYSTNSVAQRKVSAQIIKQTNTNTNNNNIKMGLVFSSTVTNNSFFKNHSTLFSENGPSKPILKTLNPEKLRKWTSEEVCSLLSTPKESGGAGLSEQFAIEWYNLNFDGFGIENIVKMIQEKNLNIAKEKTFIYYPGVSCDGTVVDWINDLLKTKLYQYWTTEHIKKQLMKSIDDGGAGLSESELNDFQSINSSLNNPEVAQKIQNWKNTNFIQVKMVDIRTLWNISIPNYEGWFPYQNNENNIFMVGEKLLHNLRIKARRENNRELYLIVNSPYHGFGTTRFGVDFLSLFRKQLVENPEKANELVKNYGKESINTILNSKTIYYDMLRNNTKETLTNLKNLPKDDHYFVVLDEFPSFCYDFLERSDALLEKMEYVWMEYIVEIQNMPNVVGVYVSGRGVFLDAFNKVVLQKNTRAPTLVHRVELQALTRKDLETIFETNPKLVKYLQNKRIYEFILTFVLSESGGVPLIVSRLLWELSIRHSNSKKDIVQRLKEAMDPIPEMIILPHGPSRTPYCISSKIFSFLMFLSQVIPLTFPPTSTLLDTESCGLNKIAELKLFKRVDIQTLATALGCYTTKTENSELKLVFTGASIRAYTPESIRDMALLDVINLIPQIPTKGFILNTMVGNWIFWTSHIGAFHKHTWGQQVLFLRNTKLFKEPCVKLTPDETKIELQNVENAKIFWEQVYNSWTEYQHKINLMLPQSFGPDMFIVFKQDLWWCIMDKSKEVKKPHIDSSSGGQQVTGTFEELNREVKNLETIPTNVNVILTILYGSEIIDNKFVGRFGPGRVLKRARSRKEQIPEITQIIIPHNVTLIVADSRTVESYIGKDNLKALKQLSVSSK